MYVRKFLVFAFLFLATPLAVQTANAQESKAPLAAEYPLAAPFKMDAVPKPQELLDRVGDLLDSARKTTRKRTGSTLGVIRVGDNAHGTWGALYAWENDNWVHRGYTLEPSPGHARGPIPLGTYAFDRWLSPNLGKTLRLHNVPDFTNILVHVGNFQRDTVGCILAGREYDEDVTRLIDSRSLTNQLYDNHTSGDIIIIAD